MNLRRLGCLRTLSVALAVWSAHAAVPAQSSPEADGRFFADRVAPVLESRCLRCHGGDARKRGLSLATRAELLSGGKSGPAAVPGRPGQSLIVRMVSGDRPRMPREGPRLSQAQVADLRQWIAGGAAWPAGLRLTSRGTGDAAWAFRPLNRPPVPSTAAGAQANPVDAFVLARLEREGLSFGPEADRRTLIRRLTFDLHGLPPTPQEIAAFEHDPGPDACERLVDRLLASPRYGERFARLWLDVAHFADSHGMARDLRRDQAWLYRDYVIRSFNEDKPYARFVEEQIAGDLLVPAAPEGIVATAFLAGGPWDYAALRGNAPEGSERRKARSLDRDDMVTSAASAFLSVTAGCARCHDHKYDPIPQRDYYKLQAVFAGLDRGDRPFHNDEVGRRRIDLDGRREGTIGRTYDARKDPPGPERDAKIASLEAERASIEKEIAALPDPGLVFTVKPRPPEEIRILARGDIDAAGAEVPPGALCAIPDLPCEFPREDQYEEGPARLALAAWIASPKNPLTWRSIANRVWLWDIGRGVVDTPNDLGGAGSRPTHPELLDWLASELRDTGGSLKQLHRLLLTSRTYRQSSAGRERAQALDAENRLLWRAHRRHLDAECVRDAMLAVSGKLDGRSGGPAFELFRYVDQFEPTYDYSASGRADRAETFRRTVYRFVPRGVPDPFLAALDAADPNVSTPIRRSSVTALQALALSNDPFVLRQAQYLAERVSETSGPLEAQVEEAVRLVFGRAPKPDERETLAAHARTYGLAAMCRLLFNANEFIFVD
jgi:mono/diheme cytochrome c family protein